jgi:hypothetical protein
MLYGRTLERIQDPLFFLTVSWEFEYSPARVRNRKVEHMKKLLIIGTVSAVSMLAAAALAQDAPQGAEGGAAAPQKMEPPKPAPELLAAAKDMSGKWKCSGKGFAGPAGPEHKTEATMNWKLDLDKFWLEGTYEEKKTKDNPHPFKLVEYRSFDASQKKWVSVGVDNMGMWAQGTGEMADKQMKWDMKANGMGMTMPMHVTAEMKSPKELHISGEMSMDGKEFKPMFESSCKK